MPINMNVLDNQFRFRPSFSGGGLRTKIFPEAASADFKYGEPVLLTVSGNISYVTQIASLPAPGNESASIADAALIVGFALANATGVQGTPVPILMAQGCEVLTRVYSDVPGDSEGADIEVGDFAEPFRYLPSAGPAFMVLSAAPHATAAKNKFVFVEKYSLNHGVGVNPAFQGEQALSDDYFLVWATVRPEYRALPL